MRALDGITVLSFEHAVAAPFATRQLADLGARVIKVERPGKGDFARDYDTRARGMSSHFVWTNRGKESLTLDLKAPEAAPILTALLAQADVVVQNLAPGAADRLGLGWDALHAAHPGLILCNISGYGPDGPYRDRKAYDLLVQAEAGLLSVTGTPEVPSKAGISSADIAAGMYAYSNILAALIQRGKTGQGTRIDVSMLEALAEWMGYPMYYAMDGAAPPARAGASHPTIFPYGPFACADGTVIFGLQNDREWRAFCDVVLRDAAKADDPAYVGNAARAAARDTLTAEIEAIFASLTVAEVTERLNKAGIANARLSDMADLWAHPQLAARNRWRDIGSPAGVMPALMPPGQVDAVMGDVPKLGGQTDAILGDLGLSAAEIAALRKAGTI